MASTDTWPLAKKFGSTVIHKVHAAGGPADGSLYHFYTICGLFIDDVGPWGWREVVENPTFADTVRDPGIFRRSCKRCEQRLARDMVNST